LLLELIQRSGQFCTVTNSDWLWLQCDL
jgi:hypothetical protein